MNDKQSTDQVALVTGGARRIGRAIVECLHACGWNIVIHCRRATDDANALAERLNHLRADSATVRSADLRDHRTLKTLATEAISWRGRMDALINNAAAFFPTPVATVTEEQWNTLMDGNVKAPLFLAQHCHDALKACNGSIVNIVDIHADRPLKKYAVYSASKAALAMLTKSLAREFAPKVRCNGISPGAIMWPEIADDDTNHQAIIARTALKREGQPDDIAKAVEILALRRALRHRANPRR